MTDFEKWQLELETAASRRVESEPAAPPVLSELDMEVSSLCAQFSEADVLAASAKTEEVQPEQPRTPLAFKRDVAAVETVEEAYAQLVGIAEELCEELELRKWGESKSFIEAHIGQLRIAHDSGQIEGLASSVVKALGRLKAGCERCASYAEKTQSVTADVGELFLLTALSAHELRRALNQVYDC